MTVPQSYIFIVKLIKILRVIVDGILITDSSTVHSYFCSEVFLHHSYHYENSFMIVLELYKCKSFVVQGFLYKLKSGAFLYILFCIL